MLGVILFRNDLRLIDNPVLVEAIVKGSATSLLPIFIWDVTFYGKDAKTWNFKLPRSSPAKERFLWESVQDLQDQLKTKGSDLLVFKGNPLDIIKTRLLPHLGKYYNSTYLTYITYMCLKI